MSTATVQFDKLQNTTLPPLSPQEQSTITLPIDPWSNARALAIAVGNFEEWSNFRLTSGHDLRLQIADELYLGWQPKKYWEGTRIPRSSLGVPISMDQIEALLPPIIGSIFPLRDNVEISPNPGTSVDESTAAFNVLMSQLDTAQIRERVRLAVKSALVYGNGILEVSWKYEKIRRRRIIAKWVPVTKDIYDPMAGQTVSMATGENRRVLTEVTDEVEVNMPELKNIPIQDFFVDPNLQTSDLNDGRGCAVRHLVPIGELKKLRGQPGFDIPSDAILIAMARGKTGTYHDTLKGMSETYRLGSWQPQNDYTRDPDQWRLEVIRYASKERCVWVFNRTWVAYNSAGYGFINFLNAFYVDIPGRFFGYAVTDAVEGEQRFQQATINARIDELNLSINAPFIMTAGASTNQALSTRNYPGKVWKTEKKDDITRMEMGNITQSAYLEVEASDRRAQKRTGVSDLSVLGTSSIGGNSANRTATGVGVQDKASSMRIKYQVENLESNFIEPLLKMVLKMNQMFLNPQQILEINGPEGQSYTIDPLKVINADVKFRIRGADKMRSRGMLLQAWPLLLQTYMNPEAMQIMGMQQQKTLDMKQMDRLLCDALQIAPMSLWREMSPQEQQGMMQMQMGPQILQAQMAQQKISAQMQQHTDKDQTNILQTLIAALPEEAFHSVLGTTPTKQLTAGKSNGKK